MGTTTITIDASDATGLIGPASTGVVAFNRNHVDGGYHWPTWRAGVIARMQAMAPQWGDGKPLYRIGHGITDGRTDHGAGFEWKGYRYETWFGKRNNGASSRYPFDDVMYGLNEAEEMGANVIMVANMGSSSLSPDVFPNETGRLAAYCNKTTNTQRSTYNATRYNDAAKPNNGRYDVVRWEMGNEMSGSFELGHASSTDPTYNRAPNEITYAQNAAKMAKAIKDNSDTPNVKTGFTICTNLNMTGSGWTDASNSYNSMKTLVGNLLTHGTIAGHCYVDAFIYHAYPAWPITTENGSTVRIMSCMTWLQTRIQWIRDAVAEWKAANPAITFDYADVEIWDTEGHTDCRTANSIGTNVAQAFIGAMYGFDRIIHCMRNQIPVCVQFCMWHKSGSDFPYDNVFFVDANSDQLTALYKAMVTLAQHWGDDIVTADVGVDCPTITSVGQATPKGDATYNVLATVASKDADNLYVLVLNRSETESVTYELSVSGWTWTPATDTIGVHKIRCTDTTAKGHWNNHSQTYTTNTPTGGVRGLVAEPMSITILEIPNTAAGGPPAATTPVVDSVLPTTGVVGDLISIFGTDLPTNVNDATIDFNGTPTPCVYADPSGQMLQANVPIGASSGFVGVTVNGTRYTGPDPDGVFTLEGSPVPTLTGFSPTFGPPGTLVTITGTNLGNPADPTTTQVFWTNGMAWAQAASHTDTAITVRVPEGALTGTLKVVTPVWELTTAATFTVTEPADAGGPGRPVLSDSTCRLYVDGTPCEGGEPYQAAWDRIDWGSASEREPTLKPTAGGTFVVYALETAMEERKGKLAIYAECKDINHKSGMLTQLAKLLHGPRRVHWGSRHLDVFFSRPREAADASRNAATALGVEAEFVAPDPLWRLNQPLNGIERPVNNGIEYGLYDDETVPVQLPDYRFTTARFTLTNWGTGWTWGAGTITGGPANGVVYLRGLGARRVALQLDANGFVQFTEAAEVYLEAGDNVIRVEDAAGALITTGPNFAISFGDTYMRFL